MFYIKTTETCNLNCSHCFTNGANGRKIFWDIEKTTAWLKTLSIHPGFHGEPAHFEFHGGEPFLASVSDMIRFKRNVQQFWSNSSWGATTNLVYNLTDEKITFIQQELGNRVGTSWDPTIRFANKKQLDLWKKNVRQLVERGVAIKLFISVTKDLTQILPQELLLFVKSLGVHELSLERLTLDGNAVAHPDIFPSNSVVDQWMYDLHEATTKLDARGWYYNQTLEDVYAKTEHNSTKNGTFCRNCEQKILTINADGRISGCPNGAGTESYGTIDQNPRHILYSDGRINNISHECTPNTHCIDCGLFQVCGGDCHRLPWEGGLCAAPKTLMNKLLTHKHSTTTKPKYNVSTIPVKIYHKYEN